MVVQTALQFAFLDILRCVDRDVFWSVRRIRAIHLEQSRRPGGPSWSGPELIQEFNGNMYIPLYGMDHLYLSPLPFTAPLSTLQTHTVQVL